MKTASRWQIRWLGDAPWLPFFYVLSTPWRGMFIGKLRIAKFIGYEVYKALTPRELS